MAARRIVVLPFASWVNERRFSSALIALRIGRLTILEELGRLTSRSTAWPRSRSIKVLLDEASGW